MKKPSCDESKLGVYCFLAAQNLAGFDWYWHDVDSFALLVKHNSAFTESKQGVVTSLPYIFAWVPFGTHLSHKDVASDD